MLERLLGFTVKFQGLVSLNVDGECGICLEKSSYVGVSLRPMTMPELHFEEVPITSTVDLFLSWSESHGVAAISIVMYTEKGFQWLMVSKCLLITELYISVG